MSGASKPAGEKKKGLGTGWKVAIGIFTVIGLMLITFAISGNEGRNNEYKPQNEFKLTPWIELQIGPIDMSINKAVLYLFIATALTCWVMYYIAQRMADRPNRVQTTVEAAYDLTFNQIVRNNMDDRMAAKWFPAIATLFFFIWFSNMIGYIPLPTNTEHKVEVFGLELPALALYAATANLSVPLVLTLFVWVSYQVEGIRAKGFVGNIKSWMPSGIESAPVVVRVLIFFVEVISQFVRIISLSVRLFANILAGHLLILFMGGGLVVLLGIAAVGWLTVPMAFVFFLFEIGLVATLQAFIFATLTSIYLGGAVGEAH